MELPSLQDINKTRIEKFKSKIVESILDPQLDFYSQIVTEIQQDNEISSEQIAAAACLLMQGNTGLLLDEKKMAEERLVGNSSNEGGRNERGRSERAPRNKRDREAKPTPKLKATPLTNFPEIEMGRFRLDVGSVNNVKPGNIVGAIANEAELESKYIGEIEIRDNYSTVDLPADIPKEILTILKRAHVSGRALGIRLFTGEETSNDKHGNNDKKESSGSGKKSYNSKKRNSLNKDVKGKSSSDYAKRKKKERSKKT